MKKDLCELVVIIDESGSMSNTINDTIGGFNTFLETHQNLPGTALLTVIKFNTNYEILYNGVNVHDVKPLDKTTYTPNGMTALYDAVGRGIDEVGKRYDAMKKKDKPGNVIFVIMTDGEENSSREYKQQQVKEKTIKRRTENKWEFIFMGADQDAWLAGGNMGSAININYTIKDTGKTLSAASYYTANTRMYSNKKSLDNFSLSQDELNDELSKINKKQNNT